MILHTEVLEPLKPLVAFWGSQCGSQASLGAKNTNADRKRAMNSRIFYAMLLVTSEAWNTPWFDMQI